MKLIKNYEKYDIICRLEHVQTVNLDIFCISNLVFQISCFESRIGKQTKQFLIIVFLKIVFSKYEQKS